MAVDTTPIQAIYDKLNQVTAYHPGSTEIFDDFLQEAGDIVTMISGTSSFDFPIFSQHMTWMGSMVTSMESTGNKERNALPPLQRKQKNGSYGAGQRVTEIDEHYNTEFVQTKKTIGMEAKAMGVMLDTDGNPMFDPNDPNEFLWDDTSSAEIFSRLILTPNRAQLVTAINNGQGASISGAKVDLSAQGTVLIQAINNQNPSQTNIRLQAAQIDLDGYVTASSISAEIAVVDALISQNGYTGNLSVTGTLTGGYVSANYVSASNFRIIGANDSLTTIQTTATVGIFGDGNYASIPNVYFLTHGSANPMRADLRHYHSITASEVTSNNQPTGQIKIVLGAAVDLSTQESGHSDTFNIAATQYYLDHVGINTVSAGGWTFTNNAYKNTVTANAKDGTSDTADVTLPTITCGVGLGTSSNCTVRAYGPTILGVSGTPAIISNGLTLYLKSDNNYVYLTNTNSTPVVSGDGANVVARAANSASGTDLSTAGNLISIGGASNSSSPDKSSRSTTITGKIWYYANGDWHIMKNSDNSDRTYTINISKVNAKVYQKDSDGDFVAYPAGHLIWTTS